MEGKERMRRMNCNQRAGASRRDREARRRRAGRRHDIRALDRRSRRDRATRVPDSAAMIAAVLILPGLYDSGPEHWQSRWETANPDFRRVVQSSWDRPRCADWVATLDRAIAEVVTADRDVVLVAHSLGCTLVARWAAAAAPAALARVRGALLVAPSDTEARSYPPGTEGFTPMPSARLPFRAIAVASADDEYVTPARAAAFAHAWGAELVEIGARGHINSASGLGDWPAGFALLDDLRRPAAR
jgi:serine hydrolase